MKKILLTTCNAKYIHKNLALRWIYTTCPYQERVSLREFTIKDKKEKIVQEILSMHVDIICFSCYIWNITFTKEIIHELKKQNLRLHIIVGGPEVSYDSYHLIKEGVDAISIGEGEQSIWEYVDMLGDTPKEIEGMYTQAFPNKTYRKVDISWLEQFDDPYFLAFDKEDMGKRYFYLETSRGCPYGCTYCLSSTDRSVRMFSMEYVMNILRKLEKSEVKQVKLLDRTFNSDPKRALQIARYMNEHCKKQIFQFEIVAETLSEDLLTFFCEEADPGRFRFEIGVQSFNTKTLTSVGRIQNNKRLQEVIARLRKANCTMHVDLIAGLPFENIKSFQASFDELFALQASEVQLGILKLLKGTKLRSQQEEYGFHFVVQAPYDIVSTAWLTQEELIAIHNCADAVEKFWNSGVCKQVIQTILHLKWYDSPFQLFMDLGKEYAKLPRPYQPYALFQCFYPILSDKDKQHVDAILLTAYYPRFKQKPHRFCEGSVTLEKKKEILNFALEKGLDNQDRLYRYGMVDVGYDIALGLGYQLILYNTKQTLPKQYFIDKDKKILKEMKEMKEIMLATSNVHKVEEFQTMLAPLGYHVKSLLDLEEVIDIVEDGKTFEENALIKAKTIYELLHIPVIADDSGLAVNAMNGEPGIYSARFLGRDTSYDEKNQYIIDTCKDAKDKGCQFVCAIAYVKEDGTSTVFRGVVEGIVAEHMEGAKGFGYDPIFYYPPYKTTLANVSEEQKNAISHRGRALAQLIQYMEEGK